MLFKRSIIQFQKFNILCYVHLYLNWKKYILLGPFFPFCKKTVGPLFWASFFLDSNKNINRLTEKAFVWLFLHYIKGWAICRLLYSRAVEGPTVSNDFSGYWFAQFTPLTLRIVVIFMNLRRLCAQQMVTVRSWKQVSEN